MIVVSDRRVIDGQLQDALFDFQRTTGVVATIKNEGEAKSAQLAKALNEGKKIIVIRLGGGARVGGDAGQVLRRHR